MYSNPCLFPSCLRENWLNHAAAPPPSCPLHVCSGLVCRWIQWYRPLLLYCQTWTRHRPFQQNESQRFWLLEVSTLIMTQTTCGKTLQLQCVVFPLIPKATFSSTCLPPCPLLSLFPSALSPLFFGLLLLLLSSHFLCFSPNPPYIQRQLKHCSLQNESLLCLSSRPAVNSSVTTRLHQAHTQDQQR